jgi:predicted phosphohydrolase
MTKRGVHDGGALVMTEKQKVKTVEICTVLHGLEFLNNVIAGEETWISQKDPETENKVSCSQKLAFLTEEDKIVTLQRTKNLMAFLT